MRLAILSTDTLHHRYFFQKINEAYDIDYIFLETSSHKPNYDIESPFSDLEEDYEMDKFFKNTLNQIPDCKIYSYPSINNSHSLSKLKEVKPDIGLVFGTGKLCKDIIDCFSFCLLNIHRGLPEYHRGLDSDLWAIEESRYDLIGTTIHIVEPELDTGDILYQEKIQLKKNLKIHQLRYYTTILAVKLSLKTLEAIKTNTFNPRPQKIKGEYYSFMPTEQKIAVSKKFNNYCQKI